MKDRNANLNTSLRQMNDYGKIPPQALDIEELVLGSLMLNRDAINEVISFLKPETFYKDAHRVIFETILKLYTASQPVDLITVTNELRKSDNLELCGGAHYITQLTSRIGSTYNIEFHARILHEKYVGREMIHLTSIVQHEAYNCETDTLELLDRAQGYFDQLCADTISGTGPKHIGEGLKSAVTEAENRVKMVRDGKVAGIRTGLKDLDLITAGWQPGELIILAARPSMGKTALMLHFAKCAALSGVPVCIYSLEMSEISLMNRLLLSETNVDAGKFKRGYMSDTDWIEIQTAQNTLNSLPIYVDDKPAVSMRYIKAHSRLMHRKGKCGIIFVDYLQLADVRTDERGRNREQEIAAASGQAKQITRELSIPFVLLSQLNRNAENRKESRPQLADLRESGAIEQDADVVAFVYRPEYYGIETTGDGIPTRGYGELMIEKHRNGGTGVVRFNHNEAMTKIYNYGEMEETIQFTDDHPF